MKRAPFGRRAGEFTEWEEVGRESDLLFYEGLHGGVKDGPIDAAKFVDLLIGVVPVVNLEWIQKIHRDKDIEGILLRQRWIQFTEECGITSITSPLSFQEHTLIFSAYQPWILQTLLLQGIYLLRTRVLLLLGFKTTNTATLFIYKIWLQGLLCLGQTHWLFLAAKWGL